MRVHFSFISKLLLLAYAAFITPIVLLPQQVRCAIVDHVGIRGSRRDATARKSPNNDPTRRRHLKGVDPGLVAAAIEAGLPLVELLIGAFGDSDTYRNIYDQYILFEGNFCSENFAGSFWPRDDKGVQRIVNAKDVAFFQNDEARSLLIQGPIKRGEVLIVYDSPDGSLDDDYTHIYVSRDMELGDGYCVDSFETSYEDATVKVQHAHDNGLDGKVSRVEN